MKRSLFAFGLCAAMLSITAFLFLPNSKAAGGGLAPDAPAVSMLLNDPAFSAALRVRQQLKASADAPANKVNLIDALLQLPAPPPRNPLEPLRERGESFYDQKNPPSDDAPIDDLIDYWTFRAGSDRGGFYYRLKPSVRVMERLLTEGIERSPGMLMRMFQLLPDDKRIGDLVKEIYDRGGEKGDSREAVRTWLKFHSPHFTDELARKAERTRDSNGYVNVDLENHVLALTRFDWEKAKPLVDRMYLDGSQPVTKVLGTWALYKHALETADLADIERYRSELMHFVEDRSASYGVRDKANDAITHETDFPGRDDWTFSLFEDETWVRMPQYTGLTTLVIYSPPDKYIARLTELANSRNKIVRTAAARCLVTILERTKDPAAVKALLPWIADPNWVERKPDDNGRGQVVSILAETKMPESVPSLIAALDEKAMREVADYGPYANMAYNAANTNGSVYFGRSNSNSTNTNVNSDVPRKQEIYYPLRSAAVRALEKQSDARAAPALRRLLTGAQQYERMELMKALLACNGYSVQEQIEALEQFVRLASSAAAKLEAEGIADANYSTNSVKVAEAYREIFEGRDTLTMLGMMVAATTEPSDALIRAAIDSIEALEPKEPIVAKTLRATMTNWKGLAVSTLLLRDLRNGKADAAAVLRLLTERKLMREKLIDEVSVAATGTAGAAGIAACILEDDARYEAILDSTDEEKKAVLLACGRLVRAGIPVTWAAAELRSENPQLQAAAELYLESEDSPEARAIVLGRHEGEVKILGATLYFKGKGANSTSYLPALGPLFESVSGPVGTSPYMYGPGNFGDDLGKTEARLQKEVRENRELAGIYSYQNNIVRIYRSRVAFSWEDDPSRYHERDLTRDEFARLRDLMSSHNAAEMKPFLACAPGNDCGTPKELLMLGPGGGSRVFVRTARQPQFFAELEKLFEEFRSEPATIKYGLSKDVPGLEVLFANEAFEAQTVWKQAGDLRLAISSASVRERVEEELAEMEAARSDVDEEVTDEDNSAEPEPEMISPVDRIRERREFEGFTWQRVENGRLGEPVAQPVGVDLIPGRDAFDVQPDQEQWKARGKLFEIRAGQAGLFKISGGKQIRLRQGPYGNPVISTNGRWLAVTKYVEDGSPQLFRIDLTTNRDFRVKTDGFGDLQARCWVPAMGKFVVVVGYYDEEDQYEVGDEDNGIESVPTYEPGSKQFYLLDPETGSMLPAVGELRPLLQQTFRQLQPASRPFEWWAALPTRGKNETIIGTYDSRTFRFKPVIKLPKIKFDSMEMWVDESENRVYFVYGGHLLRIPLRPLPPAK